MKKPCYDSAGVRLYRMDCRDFVAEMIIGLADSVVCDPPYGLKFMGKGWDSGVPGVEFWTHILSLMKPGAHLLAFGGTRTFHRLMVAIEDAGFELRDTIMWVYGSGFPKSLNVSKAIDRAVGASRKVIGTATYGDGHVQNSTESIGFGGCDPTADAREITAPATDNAREWEGWGTAIKPAWEPIIVARKPFKGTVAANVLEHGTGAINIDACRVPGAFETRDRENAGGESMFGTGAGGGPRIPADGRWPANLIHNGSDEVVSLFPDRCGALAPNKTGGDATKNVFGKYKGRAASQLRDGLGSAARFFYAAKSSKADRGRDNGHPTVKPQALMRYLCRLVTPPGGLVLDPFAGSCSTLLAARSEGFGAVGIELERRYCVYAIQRLEETEKS